MRFYTAGGGAFRELEPDPSESPLAILETRLPPRSDSRQFHILFFIFASASAKRANLSDLPGSSEAGRVLRPADRAFVETLQLPKDELVDSH
jgi:hypothetical protein